MADKQRHQVWGPNFKAVTMVNLFSIPMHLVPKDCRSNHFVSVRYAFTMIESLQLAICCPAAPTSFPK